MVTVAIDSGPLHGPRTGIGNAVAWTLDALGEMAGDTLELQPYVVSMRAKVTPPERRLPIPAAVAHRIWARTTAFPVDRLLGRPDVVHGTNYVVPPTRVPRIVTVYDCWFLEHPAEAHPDVARSGEVLRRSIAAGARVITSSDASSNQVRELLEVDATTVHLGPPPMPAAPAVRPDDLPDSLGDAPFVLALGTIERRKNIPGLVRAFGLLAKEHPSASLVIAGRDGDDSNALAAALAALPSPVADRVLRITNLAEPAKRWLLDAAAVLAYPSLDEGFGFPVLEAQSAGTPVVASSAGSIPEVAGSGALLSLPSDPHALAAHLFWVLDDPERRAALVAAGHANVERFSWARTAAQLSDLYRRAAEEA